MFQYKHGEVKPIVIKAMVKSKAKVKEKKKKESMMNYFLSLTRFPPGQG